MPLYQSHFSEYVSHHFTFIKLNCEPHVLSAKPSSAVSKIMESELNELVDVEIDGKEKITLAGDIGFTCDMTTFIAILVFLLIFIRCIFQYDSVNDIIATDILSKEESTDCNKIRVSTVLPEIPEKTQFLELFFQLKDIGDFRGLKNFKGMFRLKTIGSDHSQVFEEEFDGDLFQLSSNLKDTIPAPLFYTSYINFESSNFYAILDFGSPVQHLTSSSFLVFWKMQNPQTKMVLKNMLLCILLCEVLYFAVFFRKIYNDGFHSLVNIQILTLIMMVLNASYLVFAIISPTNELIIGEIISKNIFYGYIAFYSLSSYIYLFDNDKAQHSSFLLFPYFVFITYSVLWIIKETKHIFPTSNEIFPDITLKNLPPFYYSLLAGIFCIILSVWMILCSQYVKDSTSKRFYRYLFNNAFLMMSILFYIVLPYFVNAFRTSLIYDIYPILMANAYVYLMILVQNDTKKVKVFNLYERAGSNADPYDGSDHGIGVDLNIKEEEPAAV